MKQSEERIEWKGGRGTKKGGERKEGREEGRGEGETSLCL